MHETKGRSDRFFLALLIHRDRLKLKRRFIPLRLMWSNRIPNFVYKFRRLDLSTHAEEIERHCRHTPHTCGTPAHGNALPPELSLIYCSVTRSNGDYNLQLVPLFLYAFCRSRAELWGFSLPKISPYFSHSSSFCL